MTRSSSSVHQSSPAVFHGHLLRVCRFFRENSEDEVGLFVGLKGGGDDDVLPRRQPQPRADLPQVDEELRARTGGVSEEEISFQVDSRPPSQLNGESRVSRHSVHFKAIYAKISVQLYRVRNVGNGVLLI